MEFSRDDKRLSEGEKRGLEMSARRRREGRGKLRRNGRGNAGGRKTEQILRKSALRETANVITITLAYALTIIMVITLAAAKEKTVTGQLSRKLLEFLINSAKLSIRQIQTEGTVLRPRTGMGKRAQELRKMIQREA